MASQRGVPPHEILSLVREVQGSHLLNRQLSSICQVNGLRSTGVKAELQQRIIKLIQEAGMDQSRFAQVRQSIMNASAQRNGTSTTSSSIKSRTVSSGPHNMHFPLAVPFGNVSTAISSDYVAQPKNILTTPNLVFKDSPFYRIGMMIGQVRICEAMAQHRNTITIELSVNNYQALQQCLADSSCRVLVFCAGEAIGTQDIAFPHQSEIRVNGTDIKANLRGLKNRAGSTRPVDITHMLRLKPPNYMNSIDFTYALTAKKFYLSVNICKVLSVTELVQDISTRRRIPKESVVAELNKKAQDPDVVATSSVLSLKCPLSYMRLGVPCRGMSCAHIQCFDATSYLQLQEQGPQWLCPICNKSTQYDQLAVDEYVKDILDKTPEGLEGVTIEPNGRWLQKTEELETSKFPSAAFFDADEEEDEISEISSIPRRYAGKLPIADTQSGSRQNGSAGTKRPAPPVIDLTFSTDDEDDEPIQRAGKRQSTLSNDYQGPSSLSIPNVSSPRLSSYE